MTQFCIVIAGPNTFPHDIKDIKMGLGMAEIPVAAIDLRKRGSAFSIPQDVEAAGFVIIGNPDISTLGLREMFPTAPIIIHGYPEGGEEISDLIYAMSMENLISIAEEEMIAREATIDQVVNPEGITTVDLIEAIPPDVLALIPLVEQRAVA